MDKDTHPSSQKSKTRECLQSIGSKLVEVPQISTSRGCLDIFCKEFNVPRGLISKISLYYDTLRDWNKIHNLVQRSDLDNFWQRHAADSAQLIKYIPSPQSVIFDLGSGAGFPGLILSILTPNTVLLFESNQKKIVFLEHVIHALGLNAKVISGRIEETIQVELENQNSDVVITSRALGSVAYILSLVSNVSRETEIVYLLHKNKKQLEKEIPLAIIQWDFAWRSLPSITSMDSAILSVTSVKKKE